MNTRTNRWRRLIVISGGVFMTLLLLGVYSAIRAILGIDYGLFSVLLSLATIAVAAMTVIHIEYTVHDREEAARNHPSVEEPCKDESGEEQEMIAIPGDDGEVWVLNEDGMSTL